MMRIYTNLRLVMCVCVFYAALSLCARKQEVSVLQWNVWQEGTVVPGGYDAIVNEISRLRPDFVTLSEVRNYNGVWFLDRVIGDLKQRGLTYYTYHTYSSGLLSRYPVEDSAVVYPLKNDQGSVHRLITRVGKRKVALYAAHLDYRDCAYYNVKGYDGSTWAPCEIPKTVGEVLARNEKSKRDDAICAFLQVAQKDLEDGAVVILGGDFNEPSHLDWTSETKNLYDHHGMVIPWTVTSMLDKAGYVDAYRKLYPNAVTHPGFTYPSDNKDVPVSKLTWAPEADERDRIDFIFYQGKGLHITDARIFGPSSSIMNSCREPSTSKDVFITPKGVWPTDHKGLLVKFKLK